MSNEEKERGLMLDIAESLRDAVETRDNYKMVRGVSCLLPLLVEYLEDYFITKEG